MALIDKKQGEMIIIARVTAADNDAPVYAANLTLDIDEVVLNGVELKIADLNSGQMTALTTAAKNLYVGTKAVAASVAPTAPRTVAATGGSTTATVTFTAPYSTGGSAVTGYTVVSTPAGGTDTNAGTTALSHSITGLTNGVAYTFKVTATNAAGTSVASDASNSVTPA